MPFFRLLLIIAFWRGESNEIFLRVPHFGDGFKRDTPPPQKKKRKKKKRKEKTKVTLLKNRFTREAPPNKIKNQAAHSDRRPHLVAPLLELGTTLLGLDLGLAQPMRRSDWAVLWLFVFFWGLVVVVSSSSSVVFWFFTFCCSFFVFFCF